MQVEERGAYTPIEGSESQPAQWVAYAGRIFTRRCALGAGCALLVVASLLTPTLMLTVSPSEKVRDAGRNWLIIEGMAGGLISLAVACAIWGPRSSEGWTRD